MFFRQSVCGLQLRKKNKTCTQRRKFDRILLSQNEVSENSVKNPPVLLELSHIP